MEGVRGQNTDRTRTERGHAATALVDLHDLEPELGWLPVARWREFAVQGCVGSAESLRVVKTYAPETCALLLLVSRGDHHVLTVVGPKTFGGGRLSPAECWMRAGGKERG